MFDQLRHTAFVKGNHRGPASHGFYHGQTKRLGEMDWVQQCQSISQHFIPPVRSDTSDKLHIRFVQTRFYTTIIIISILDNSGYYKSSSCLFGDFNRFFRSFIRMNTSEKQQVIPARMFSKRKFINIDPVVHRSCIVQVRRTIGVTDRDIIG